MTPTMLNLAPLIDGYKWLLDNPEHFSMSTFLGKKQDDEWYKTHRLNKDKVFYQTLSNSPIKPERGTFLCICGASLLANAIKQKKQTFQLNSLSYSVPASFMVLLKQTNEHLPEEYFDWEEVQYRLSTLFYGEWYIDNVKFDLDALPLEEAWKGIKFLCDEWGYVPDMTGYEQYEWLKGSLPQ